MVHVVDQLLPHGPMRQRPARPSRGHVRCRPARSSPQVAGSRSRRSVVPSAPLPLANSEPPPTARRSWYSWREATCQPSSTSPTTASSPSSEVVEELFAELGGAVDLRDAPQRDARAVDGHQEHRQALVLGHVPVGAGQHQAVVGGKRAGAPRLRAVDDPVVGHAVGAGDHPGQVRSTAGFRQATAQAPRRRAAQPKCVAVFVLRCRCRGSSRQQMVNVGVFRMSRHLVVARFRRRTPFDTRWAGRAHRTPREADAGEPAVVKPSL